MNKITWFVWIIVVILSMWGVAQASTGVITSGSITETITTRAQEQSIIADSSDLDSTVTRAQAAQLYLNIAKNKRWNDKIIALMSGATNTGCSFDDIKDNSYERIITTACQRWIMKWVNGSFEPGNKLTPLQALVTLVRITHGAQDEDGTPRYQSYVNLAMKKNIITQSDILIINSGTNISTNQILQWTYASSHHTGPSWIQKVTKALTITNANTGTQIVAPVQTGGKVARDASKSNNKRARLKWIKWVLLVLIVRGVLRLLSQLLRWEKVGSRNITWDTPSWIYDDLTIIEGIGPKVQQILYENGILTYDTLSRLTAGHISNIISPYGTTYESMNPVTWPRQAQLAREGQRDEFEILKQELKKWIQ